MGGENGGRVTLAPITCFTICEQTIYLEHDVQHKRKLCVFSRTFMTTLNTTSFACSGKASNDGKHNAKR